MDHDDHNATRTPLYAGYGLQAILFWGASKRAGGVQAPERGEKHAQRRELAVNERNGDTTPTTKIV